MSEASAVDCPGDRPLHLREKIKQHLPFYRLGSLRWTVWYEHDGETASAEFELEEPGALCVSSSGWVHAGLAPVNEPQQPFCNKQVTGIHLGLYPKKEPILKLKWHDSGELPQNETFPLVSVEVSANA